MRPTDAELAKLLRHGAERVKMLAILTHEPNGAEHRLSGEMKEAAAALASSGAPAEGPEAWVERATMAMYEANGGDRKLTGAIDPGMFNDHQCAAMRDGALANYRRLARIALAAAPPRSPAPPSGEAWKTDEKVNEYRKAFFATVAGSPPPHYFAEHGWLPHEAVLDVLDLLCAAVAASVQQGEQP